MQHEHETSPPSPTAPPPMHGGPGVPPQTAWPNVIGIILIVMGTLGSIGAAFGLIMVPFAEQFVKLMEEFVPPGQPTGMEGLIEHKTLMACVSLSALVLGITLLCGGIGMVKRRGWAIPVCVVWAVLKSIHVVVNAWAAYEVQQTQFAAMAKDPNMAGVPQGFFGTIGAVGAIIGVLWGWALPVFLLIWISRRKIREETLAWS